jgi:hypothetical protein
VGGAEWRDIVSHAERSGWRMTLDVLVFNAPHEVQYHIIPLRSNKTVVHNVLRTLADELRPVDQEA